jgi:hypothetical protein
MSGSLGKTIKILSFMYSPYQLPPVLNALEHDTGTYIQWESDLDSIETSHGLLPPNCNNYNPPPVTMEIHGC